MSKAEKGLYYCTKWVATRGIVTFCGVAKKDESSGKTYVHELREDRCWNRIILPLGQGVFASLTEATQDARTRAVRKLERKLRQVERARQLCRYLGVAESELRT